MSSSIKRHLLSFVIIAGVVADFSFPPYTFGGAKVAVGYYYFWSRYSYPYNSIEYNNLTHIAHAFVVPQSDGRLALESGASWQDFLYPQMIQAAHQHGVKVVVSVGGWGNSAGFSPMVANPTARANFAHNLKNFCMSNGYDGVDIDWEYPTSSDRANVTALLEQLHDTLTTVNPPLTLSIAAPSTDWNGGYDFAAIKGVLDWIGVMAYDFHGSWTNHAGHNSPLYAPPSDPEGSVDQSVKYYLGNGIPSQKLLIGLPFYGWLFYASRLYGPSTGGKQLYYSAIVDSMQQGWAFHWDTLSFVPYLTNPSNTQLISYDDTLSMRYKCDYLVNKSLGGVIIWALGQDNLGNSQPLLETAGRELGIITSVDENPLVWNQNPKVARGFELLQNYPNPFNPSTTISYQLSANSFVTLKVFDVLGREVETLVNQRQNAGSYTVTFDASKLPSGVYFYRLTTGSLVETKKMAVLK